jgi:hypothetical protein
MPRAMSGDGGSNTKLIPYRLLKICGAKPIKWSPSSRRAFLCAADLPRQAEAFAPIGEGLIFTSQHALGKLVLNADEPAENSLQRGPRTCLRRDFRIYIRKH